MKNVAETVQKNIDNPPFVDYNTYCAVKKTITGCGSAWLERLVWDQEVAGSNPVTPIDYAGVVQW